MCSELTFCKTQFLYLFLFIFKYSGTSVHECPCSRTIRFTNNLVHEQFGSRTIFPGKNGVSDYEHASWQQREAEIGAGVSVAG
jgi:hypothetical protein